MSGRPDTTDPLDRIEEQAKARQYDVALHGGDQATQDWAAIPLGTGDVLALVAVARAARDIPPEMLAMLPKVRKALARLDGAR